MDVSAQCLLYESELSDVITVHVDLLGAVYGVSVAAARHRCDGAASAQPPAAFNTTVMVSRYTRWNP